VTPDDEENATAHGALKWTQYVPPARRLDGGGGLLAARVLFGKFKYTWRDYTFLLYLVEGRDGAGFFPQVKNNYIVSDTSNSTNSLVLAAGEYTSSLHGEIWVFDQGYWQKDAGLWASIQNSNWEDVILDKDMKNAIVGDVNRFFDSRSTYARLKVPWKRGIIYYGPPGNGKTISIKATMHMLYQRKDPVPTLYVKTLNSFAGPEYSLNQIFRLARREAPCYLVFEDLDSMVTPNVRSFFLNQVDGLSSNDGILMIGSTNHLDRLDPGIAKRPSRFDRKYLFPDPSFDQRVQYAQYWRQKLNKPEAGDQENDSKDKIDFPESMCKAVASITDRFSFAYIQEAFVASLLAIAARDDDRSASAADEDAEAALSQRMRQTDLNDWLSSPREKEDGDDDTDPSAAAFAWGDDYREYADLFFRAKQQQRQQQARAETFATPAKYRDTVGGKIRVSLTGGGGDDVDPGLDRLVLWRELKKQIKILREEIKDGDDQ